MPTRWTRQAQDKGTLLTDEPQSPGFCALRGGLFGFFAQAFQRGLHLLALLLELVQLTLSQEQGGAELQRVTLCRAGRILISLRVEENLVHLPGDIGHARLRGGRGVGGRGERREK